MKSTTNLYQQIIQESVKYNTINNLKLIYSCIDLTNLNNYATTQNIEHLCYDALRKKFSDIEIPQVAAVCVYPVYVELCKQILEKSVINIATVSAGFPSAQAFPEVKYLETELALKHGATEIDIVLNLSAFFNKNESLVFDEIKTIKQICGCYPLKVILETQILSEEKLIREASFMILEAGADFLKTSTGKEGSMASHELFYVMAEVVKEHFNRTKFKAGIKAAGGIKSTTEAIGYLAITKELLGEEWLNNRQFRIGASKLAENLLNDIQKMS